MNRPGLKLSPCVAPTLLVNGFGVEVSFILVTITLPLRRNYISLCSSSSTIVFFYYIPGRWRLSIVSEAADISLPEILIVDSSFSAFANSHLCVHTTSVMLRTDRNPL